MHDIWSIGPTAVALGLRARKFSPAEADRLTGVLQRDARGEFPDLTAADKKRLLFACWLKDHGRLTDAARPGEVVLGSTTSDATAHAEREVQGTAQVPTHIERRAA